MSEPEQPFKPVPVNDDVIFKLSEGTEISVAGSRMFSLYSSDDSPICTTKQLFKRVANSIRSNSKPDELFYQGIKAAILQPGKKWVSGKFRFRLIFEFVPDDPEDDIVSCLDDIRKLNL